MSAIDRNMKIVKVSNFGDETVNDQLIADNLIDHWAGTIVDLLNANCSGDYHPDHFEMVRSDYELYVFKP